MLISVLISDTNERLKGLLCTYNNYREITSKLMSSFFTMLGNKNTNFIICIKIHASDINGYSLVG